MASREQLTAQMIRGAQPEHHKFWIVVPVAQEAALRSAWDRYNNASRRRAQEVMGALGMNAAGTHSVTGTSRLTRAELQVLVDAVPGVVLDETWLARGWQE